jgi:hypothetical protein
LHRLLCDKDNEVKVIFICHIVSGIIVRFYF